MRVWQLGRDMWCSLHHRFGRGTWGCHKSAVANTAGLDFLREGTRLLICDQLQVSARAGQSMALANSVSENDVSEEHGRADLEPVHRMRNKSWLFGLQHAGKLMYSTCSHTAIALENSRCS